MSPTCPGSIWCQRESSVLTLKNDLSQQDLEGGGWCLWQSPAPCWQPNRVEEEGIIRITQTNIQIHTSMHKYSCTERSHALHQTWENLFMPACTGKESKCLLTDTFYLKQSMTLWLQSCHNVKHCGGARQASTQPKATGKRDYMTNHILVTHISNISINTGWNKSTNVLFTSDGSNILEVTWVT